MKKIKLSKKVCIALASGFALATITGCNENQTQKDNVETKVPTINENSKALNEVLTELANKNYKQINGITNDVNYVKGICSIYVYEENYVKYWAYTGEKIIYTQFTFDGEYTVKGIADAKDKIRSDTEIYPIIDTTNIKPAFYARFMKSEKTSPSDARYYGVDPLKMYAYDASGETRVVGTCKSGIGDYLSMQTRYSERNGFDCLTTYHIDAKSEKNADWMNFFDFCVMA